MDFQQIYPIIRQYLTAGSKRRSGRSMILPVKFVVAHDTGNLNSTAQNNVSYYENSRDEISASAHIFVDDRTIIECIPALTSDNPERAWHVLYNVTTDNLLYGADANNSAIGIEYCFGTKIDPDEAYKRYLWVISYACFRFGLDPSKSVVGHFFLDPHRKTDPVTGLAHSRRSYDQLLKDIVTMYNTCTGQVQPSAPLVIGINGSVQAASSLNIRWRAPNRSAAVVQTVPPGTRLDYVGWVENGETIHGNSKWYKDAGGNFFWSGGVI